LKVPSHRYRRVMAVVNAPQRTRRYRARSGFFRPAEMEKWKARINGSNGNIVLNTGEEFEGLTIARAHRPTRVNIYVVLPREGEWRTREMTFLR